MILLGCKAIAFRNDSISRPLEAMSSAKSCGRSSNAWLPIRTRTSCRINEEGKDSLFRVLSLPHASSFYISRVFFISGPWPAAPTVPRWSLFVPLTSLRTESLRHPACRPEDHPPLFIERHFCFCFVGSTSDNKQLFPLRAWGLR